MYDIKNWILDIDNDEQSIAKFAKDLFILDWVDEYHKQDDLRIFELNIKVDNIFLKVNYPNGEYKKYTEIPMNDIFKWESLNWVVKWYNYFIIKTFWSPSIEDFNIKLEKNINRPISNYYEFRIYLTFVLRK